MTESFDASLADGATARAGATPCLGRLPLTMTLLLAALLLAGAIVLHDARRQPPPDAEAAARLVRSGQRDLQARDWQQAVDHFSQALAADRAAPDAYLGRAKGLLAMGELDAAARDFRAVLSLRPSLDEAEIGRMSIHYQRGDLAGAFALGKDAVARHQTNPDLHVNLARLYTAAGDRDAVTREVNAASDLYRRAGNDAASRQLQSTLPGDSASPPAQQPQLPRIEDVISAERLLMAAYVDELDPGDLLESAWIGARNYAQRQGVSLRNLPSPLFRSTQLGSELTMRSALQNLVRLAGDRASATDIVVAAISAMANSLDDNHTLYAPAQPLDAASAAELNNFGYNGVPSRDGSRVLVREVVPGSPAEQAGIRPGDSISALEAVKGTSSVRFHVERPTAGATTVSRAENLAFDAVLSPAETNPPLLRTSLVAGDIGYVNLAYFPSPVVPFEDGLTFPRLLDVRLSELESLGARAWVLDLRSNPGGLLVSASIAAGRFGYRGQLLKELRRDQGVTYASAFGKSGLRGRPLAVLVDQTSTSSAEVLAATLQDAGLAYLIGETTSGKVNAAVTYGLAGGVLEVTAARVLTGPAERKLDEAGVVPDETVALDPALLLQGRDSQLEAAVSYFQRVLAGRTR